MAERSRLECQDRRPRPLQPRERTGVADVDAGVHEREITAPNHAPEVVRGQTTFERLLARNDAGLQLEQVLEHFHAGYLPSGCRR